MTAYAPILVTLYFGPNNKEAEERKSEKNSTKVILAILKGLNT